MYTSCVAIPDVLIPKANGSAERKSSGWLDHGIRAMRVTHFHAFASIWLRHPNHSPHLYKYYVFARVLCVASPSIDSSILLYLTWGQRNLTSDLYKRPTLRPQHFSTVTSPSLDRHIALSFIQEMFPEHLLQPRESKQAPWSSCGPHDRNSVPILRRISCSPTMSHDATSEEDELNVRASLGRPESSSRSSPVPPVQLPFQPKRPVADVAYDIPPPIETHTSIFQVVEPKQDLSRKHVCPKCNKRFNRPSSLRIHLNTHTGATPFNCPWPNCGREFNVNSNMRRHYRNHTGNVDIPDESVSLAMAPLAALSDQIRANNNNRLGLGASILGDRNDSARTAELLRRAHYSRLASVPGLRECRRSQEPVPSSSHLTSSHSIPYSHLARYSPYASSSVSSDDACSEFDDTPAPTTPRTPISDGHCDYQHHPTQPRASSDPSQLGGGLPGRVRRCRVLGSTAGPYPSQIPGTYFHTAPHT